MAERNGRRSLVVFTTLPSADEARAFVRHLVEDRLVACGTVLDGVTSIYRWEKKVTETTETLVMLKTGGSRWDDLVTAVETTHPYDVPELLALPVEAGLARYLEWLTTETDASEELG